MSLSEAPLRGSEGVGGAGREGGLSLGDGGGGLVAVPQVRVTPPKEQGCYISKST